MNKQHKTGTQYGYTLTELMIAITVAVILMLVATESYGSFRQKTKSETARGELSISVQQAMRTALGQGKSVILCPSSDGQQCIKGYNWTSGWMGFVDGNKNRKRDRHESVLLTHDKLDRDTTLISSPRRTRIAFHANGTTAGSNVTFTICDDRGSQQAITLVMSNSGRMRARSATTKQGERCMSMRQ